MNEKHGSLLSFVANIYDAKVSVSENDHPIVDSVAVTTTRREEVGNYQKGRMRWLGIFWAKTSSHTK